MKTQTIKVHVRDYGKAPKSHGLNAYKFSSSVVSILKRNGWTLLGRGRNYHYLIHPEGHSGRDVIVSVSIPVDIEIERLASTLHEEGKQVIQEVDDWTVMYHPAHQCSVVQTNLLDRGKQIGPAQSFTVPASFQIGSFDAWYVSLNWKDGDNEPPHWHRHEENLVADVPDCLQSELILQGIGEDEAGICVEELVPPVNVLREGEIQQELVNSYERNPEARRQCIKHYGVNCAVCGFNFAERYGVIGEDFIHVHHLRPLSHVRGEYEVDPIRDLIPVCPNCHAMLHRRNPPYSLCELQSIYKF